MARAVPQIRWLHLAAATAVTVAAGSAAADQLVYDAPEGRQTVDGRVAARTDTELLFVGRDGRMHLMDLARVIQITASDEPPKAMTREEIAQQLRSEFGPGFRVYTTTHYVVCYNSDPAFARSCGRLFEKLHAAFSNYFKQRGGFQLEPNEFPLVAIVFGTEQEFMRYAQRELGADMAQNVIGFYSFLTNRMVMYDMDGGGARRALGNIAIRPPLARPINNNVNLSTIIHEATHQLAYNCGFHQRFSDNPLWLAEGVAMFFEAERVGEINALRLQLFREERAQGKPVDIRSLVLDDERMRNKNTALVAYSEAWALTYFLITTRREAFFEYLRTLSRKPPLAEDSPEQRLADFQAAFGSDIAKLEEDFVRYMMRLP